MVPQSRVRPRLRRALKGAVALVAAAAVVGCGYAVLVEHRSRVAARLPRPTGAYVVGRTESTLTDPSRDGRRLAVWAWYPAAAGTGGRATYLPGAWAGLQLGLPLGETHLDRVQDPALEGAEPADGRFPLVVFEPGLGFAAPQYAGIAEDIASHGYVVLGVTPTDSAHLTVIDGRPVTATEQGDPPEFNGDHTPHDETVAARLLRTWVADARFTADSLATFPAGQDLSGHVDAGEIAYVGHSFGGTAALQACRDDPRCRAAVDVDGGIFGSVARSGLSVPTLLVGHQGSCITGACSPRTTADRSDQQVADAFRAASTGPVAVTTVAGTGHLAFTDYGVYYLALPLRRFLGLGDRNGVEALRETAASIETTLVTAGLAAP